MKNLEISQSFTIWNPDLTSPLQILLEPWSSSSERDIDTDMGLSLSIKSKERTQFRSTLQVKDLVLHPLVRT